MTRFAPVYRALGMIIMLFGLTMLAPLILSYVVNDGAQTSYDEAFALTMLSGFYLWYRYRRCKRELNIRDGFLMVVLVWTVLPAFAAIPLMVQLGISHTDAYFETVSGLTTTGSTVLSNIDTLPMSINLWRHQLVWVGGMGLIVLAIAILPLLGIGGRQMFKAETPGPMKESSLTPRIAETAKGLWKVYFVFTVLCALAYWLAGMDRWDAVMHAFSTMGLGGFSTRDAGLGHYASLQIEIVAVVFALISGINYATHYMAFAGFSWQAYRRDPELPYFLGALAVSTVALSAYLIYLDVFPDAATALRHVALHVVSLSTSLGLATTDYGQWPMFAQLWMLFLGSFAACSGSTGGGIKMIRAMILYKQVYRELVLAMHPRAVYPARVAGVPVEQKIVAAVMAFGFIYMVSIVSLTLLMSASGLDILTGFSAVVASINNTGPGLNLVGPSSTFAVLSDFQTWLCCFAMLLGRLEIFTLLVVLTPSFWRR